MPESRTTRRTLAIAVGACLLLLGATAAVAGADASLFESTPAAEPAVDDSHRSALESTPPESAPNDALAALGRDSDASGSGGANADPGSAPENRSEAARNDEPPIEDEYVEPAPEPGDQYFEAAASDGSWVSYINPRDEYRSPYLGDGSGKICVTLLNEDGAVVAGETVPNTTVTIPTGDSVAWHPHADPVTVELPLTDHYDRPLDADQFGTSPDVAQGDGYMDAHCIEIHGLPENETVEYGEARVDGAYADWIDVVGYVQQEHEAWDTDVDPVEDAVPYEEAGGWTYHPGGSHGQAVVVLQLDPPDDAYAGDVGGDESTNETETKSAASQQDEGEGDSEGERGSQSESESENDGEDESERSSADAEATVAGETENDDESEGSGDENDDPLAGFGTLVAITAIVTLVGVRSRTRR